MTVTDKIGREINKGSYIIYTNTGTIGKVLDTKTDDTGSWVLIAVDELKNLWYNTEYVELSDEKYAKSIDTTDEKNKKISTDELKEQINTHISSEMSDDGVGGG